MGLVVVTAAIALVAVLALWKKPGSDVRRFPWAALLACVAAVLLVRAGFKWGPLVVGAYFAWSRWSRILAALSRAVGGKRGGTRTAPAPRSTAMSREDARRVLGVGPDATPEQILEGYRRLMKRVHPDAGGSDDLAARVNQAKAVLLGP